MRLPLSLRESKALAMLFWSSHHIREIMSDPSLMDRYADAIYTLTGMRPEEIDELEGEQLSKLVEAALERIEAKLEHIISAQEMERLVRKALEE